MHAHEQVSDGLISLTGALLSYFQEVQEHHAVITRHSDSVALHTASSQMEVYRMFTSTSEVAESLRNTAKTLPSWNTSPYWMQEGKKWEKLKNQIEARMERHCKQRGVLTQGIAWHNRAILIHAYKFEPDTRMKIELVVPILPTPIPELPTKILADTLACHEYLVPEYIAKPLPYYQGHDANFQSLPEYLSQTMPSQLYASQCFPLPRINGGS